VPAAWLAKSVSRRHERSDLRTHALKGT